MQTHDGIGQRHAHTRIDLIAQTGTGEWLEDGFERILVDGVKVVTVAAPLVDALQKLKFVNFSK